MGIWYSHVTLEAILENNKNTLSDHLGITFTELGEDYLTARMPVDHRTHQPIGLLHGGASCVLAETVGSTAANLCVDVSQYYCVGVDINTNHIHSVRTGHVTGTAKPFHIGKSTQVWGIMILDETEKLISVTRLTLAVLTRSLVLQKS